MLVYVAIDPEVFSPECLKNIHNQYYLRDLLQKIYENGIILCDSNNILKNNILNNLLTASENEPKLQKIVTLFEEILKSKKIFNIQTEKYDDLDFSIFIKICKNSEQLIDDIIKVNIINNEYNFSKKFEKLNAIKKNHEFKHLPPLDLLSHSKFREVFSRVFRVSNKVTFFDSHFGKIPKGDLIKPKRFSKGLISFADLFIKSSHSKHLSIAIITTCFEISTEFVNLIKENYIDPIKQKYPKVFIEITIKSDPDNIFHDRYMSTNRIILSFTRGFDIYSKNETFNRNYITYVNEAQIRHTTEYKNLHTVAKIE